MAESFGFEPVGIRAADSAGFLERLPQVSSAWRVLADPGARGRHACWGVTLRDNTERQKTLDVGRTCWQDGCFEGYLRGEADDAAGDERRGLFRDGNAGKRILESISLTRVSLSHYCSRWY